MTESQTKECLTRHSIEQALWRINAADLKIAVINISLTCAIGIPMTMMMVFLRFPWLCVLLPLVPIVIVLYQNYNIFMERIALKRGAFDVIRSSVYCKDETHTRHGMSYYFRFESFPPYEVNDTAYRLASAGDPYFLVLYKTARPRIKLCYSAKTYEYPTV